MTLLKSFLIVQIFAIPIAICINVILAARGKFIAGKVENPKGVVYTNTAIGFEKLNPEILKEQKVELLNILGKHE